MQSIWSAQQIRGARPYQEDFFAVVENNAIYYKGERIPLGENSVPAHHSMYILADGMGGMGHGDVAAEKVLEEFINSYISLNNGTQSLRNKFSASLTSANRSISSLIQNDPELEGMGSTFVAVLANNDNDTLQWISVGDSPLWLVRKGNLKRLNEIHTIREINQKQRQKKQAVLVDEQEEEEIGHYLASAITGDELEYIDSPDKATPLKHGDIIILASDGMETLPPYVIETIATGHLDEILNTNDNELAFNYVNKIRAELIEKIISLDNEEQDNTTLIVSIFLDNQYSVAK